MVCEIHVAAGSHFRHGRRAPAEELKTTRGVAWPTVIVAMATSGSTTPVAVLVLVVVAAVVLAESVSEK